jgi:hypothetical protein
MQVQRSSATRVRRGAALFTSVCLAGTAAAATFIGLAVPAGADTKSVDFESYATGSVDGQDGWSSTGDCAPGHSYDQAIVDNSAVPGAPASFGAQSLRISDAKTSGCFGDQTFSKATDEAAGEPTADTGGFPTGTLQTRYTATFDFASVTPDAEQPGLHLSASPDRGDGARMSYVRIEDSASGWNVYFDDYKDNAPLGATGSLDAGCGAEDAFTNTLVAPGVSRVTPHTIQFVMDLLPGAHNDIVKLLLDGNVIATGTSWEDYFRFCHESGGGDGGPLADQSRIVRNLLIREAGTAHPANAGAGFLVDNLSIATSTPTVPGAPVIGSATAGNGQATVTWTAPAGDGGFPVTGYVVTPYIGLAPKPSTTFNSTATVQTVTGLTNGTQYRFKVAAINFLGTGPMSHVSNAVVPSAPLTVADPPTDITALAGDAKVRLSWTAPVNRGGSAIAGYVVTPYIGAAAQTPITFNSPSTVEGILGLTNGTTYTFKVATINGSGTGAMSAASNPATPTALLTVADPPTDVTALAGVAKVRLSWTAPVNRGGTAITGYVVTPYIGAVAQTPITFNSASTVEGILGLTRGTTYTFRVATINSVGTGPMSAPSNPATPT